MKIVKIKIIKESLNISLIENDKLIRSVTNINKITNGELLYTPNYIKIKKNKIKIYKSICEFANLNFCDNVTIDNNDIAFKILDILNYFPNLKKYILTEESSLNKKMILKLKELKNIKCLYCYFIPEDYIHYFTKKNISVVFSFNKKFTSGFVNVNKLDNMKKIYYKKNIIIHNELFNDFKLFLTINKYLKVINIYKFDIEFLTNVIKALNNINCDNVMILLHQTKDNTEYINKNIKKLKKINKKYKTNNYREIKLVYNTNFIKNNLFKQLSYNNLKICSIIILYLGFIALISEYYNKFITEFNIQLINTSLAETEIIDPVNEELIEDTQIEGSEEKTLLNDPYTDILKNFNSLLIENSDTVGWLKVNGTDIDYPVVQSENNDYYLSKDFYKNNSGNGWIFMDYRNNAKNLDRNTIIYGHSMKSGLMFGTLYYTAYNDWFELEENRIVTFNTIYEELTWEVFSIYKIPKTSDYLQKDFYNDEQFIDFINLIKNRSSRNFDVEVNEKDKILTLSTCAGDGTYRRVLHAKLID